MTAADLMARAENALRTGQTENLFPVLARRALELIEEEKQANRREWVKLDPMKGIDFAFDGVVHAFAGAAEALARIGKTAGDAAEAWMQFFNDVESQRQSDYVLVSGGAR